MNLLLASGITPSPNLPASQGRRAAERAREAEDLWAQQQLSAGVTVAVAGLELEVSDVSRISAG